MWSILLFIAIGVGEEVCGAVFYTEHPVEEYHPADKVKYRYYAKPQVSVIPASPKYIYKEVPEYYQTDKDVTEGYYEHDGLSKSLHDAQKSAIHKVEEIDGDHHLVVDSVGKHGYDEGAFVRKSADEGKIAAEKSKQYGATSKDGYGGHGNAGYKKSHKATGFHKSYNKEESGKDYHYIDEDHKHGGEDFGKSYDKEYSEGGREGYANANSGAGYEYSSAGGSDEGSAVRTSAVHDSKYGHDGRKGSFSHRDTAARHGLDGTYHRGIHTGGHHYGRYEPIY